MSQAGFRRLFLILLPTVALTAGCKRARSPAPGPASTSPRMQAQAPIVPAPPPPPAPKSPPSKAKANIALIYSGDLRGRVSAQGTGPDTEGGLARRATVVDRARLEVGTVAQVDAGDFLPVATDTERDPAAPGPKDLPRWLELVANGYRRLGVDAVTLGERELAQDPRRLRALLQAAHVQVVLANLVDRKGAPAFPADKLIDADGISIGVFGVTELGAASAALKEKWKKAGYTLTPPEEAARTTAASLRARGAAFVVALVHAESGQVRGKEIVAGARDVDVAILGHGGEGHDGAVALIKDDARPHIATAGGRGMSVGRMDVRFGATVAEHKTPAIEDRVVPLTKAIKEQLGVGLLTRVLTVPMFDSDRLMAQAKKLNRVPKEMIRDLYEHWDYASTKACGYCHEKQVPQWNTTDHSHALATLKKGKHDHDPACLGCHVMGYLQPGGTRDIVMALGGFADVGCEACHGPSAEHVRSVNKKKGTSRHVDPIICLGCHTPDWNTGPFDPIAATKEILGPGHAAPPGGATH
jgi:Cytochrome c554 and c-prime